jgi:tetratricopeptide (TPR) repeat protein
MGRLDEAIASSHKAIALDPKHVEAHNNLGVALQDKGALEQALACYREAARLKPSHAEAHCNFGLLLQQQGQFAAARAELRRGHELGSKKHGWRYPSAQWLRQAEELARLDERLSAVLEGRTQPKDAVERVVFAQLCWRFHKRYAVAARFYADAFTERPALAADLRAGQRYYAACVAALAVAGKGDDGAGLAQQERVRQRRQALDWLQADLEAWRKLLEKEPDRIRPVIVKQMLRWLADADFAEVRDKGPLARLPAEERAAWTRLWADVTDLLARTKEPTPKDKEKPDKP